MRKIILSVFLLIIVHEYSNCQTIWMAGPTFHLDLGNHHIKPSFGFEVSCWKVIGVLCSVDAGFEYSIRRFRVYSEVQSGIGLTGASFGPVLEKGNGESIKIGLQGSCWINYFLGLDYRVRYMDGSYYQCPGTYFKLPLNINEINNELDKHHIESSHHHHHDLFDD